MGKIQYIEASQEWICPETGSYKVICVGGGGGGYSTSGGTTSFGTYLSAKGGISASAYSQFDYTIMGGEGGYTVNGVYGGSGAAVYKSNDGTVCCGISAVGNGGNAHANGSGYGAGGGSLGYTFGAKGELKADILTLAKDDVVACTVGTGGKASSNGTAGNDGVIIIEFLGTEA